MSHNSVGQYLSPYTWHLFQFCCSRTSMRVVVYLVLVVFDSLLWCVCWQAEACLTASQAGERLLESSPHQCQGGKLLPERPRWSSIGKHPPESSSLLLPVWRKFAQPSNVRVRLQTTCLGSSLSVYWRAHARWSPLLVSYHRPLSRANPVFIPRDVTCTSIVGGCLSGEQHSLLANKTAAV